MNRQLAQMALAFLQRVDLKGAEVPAFLQVLAALSEIKDASPQTPTTPHD